MRINHNIAALNTYRQLGQSNNAMGNSMEKLSSGLRINKAGDDAAGLAISEKMRGQVRGLEQAQRNSQDGISMIQTAEGALNETHSILQRMRELATQASNDTNTDSDRGEIQKEMNQLTSEINRIGNTTEFNTQSLLKGAETKSDIGAVASELTSGTDETITQAEWETGTISGPFSDTEDVTFSFNGVDITVNNEDNVTGGTAVVAGATDNAATVNIDTATGQTVALSDQIDAIVDGFKSVQDAGGLEGFTIEKNTAGDGFKITGPQVESAAQYNNQSIYMKHDGGGSQTVANDNSTDAKSSLTVSGVNGELATNASSTLSFSDIPTEGSTFEVAGKSVAFYDSSSDKFADEGAAKTALDADEIIDVNSKTTSDIASEVASITYTNASAKASGSEVTFTANASGAGQDADVAIETADAHEGTKSNYEAEGAAKAPASSSDLSTNDDFELTIQAGGKTFTASTADLAIDFTDAANNLSSFGGSAQTQVLDALKNAQSSDGTKLSEVVDVSFKASDDATLTFEAKEVGTDNIKTILTGDDAGTASTALGIAQHTDKGTAGTDAFENGGQDFSATFQVGANEGQSMSINIGDMRAQSLGITGEAGTGNYTSGNNVTDGTNNENVEAALDVSTSESASAAITKINDAIEQVSAQRSNLGAYQNRLDHTINNLGTSSENLTAAESRIRDVDYAIAA